MTKYSRQAFKEWLSNKPSDEKFCKGRCPIQVFMGGDMGLMAAFSLDIDFGEKIDNAIFDSHGFGHGWEPATPAQCLQIISYLESDAADRGQKQ